MGNRKSLSVRIFLLLFIIAIFLWIIPSTIGFINLDSDERSGELPQWLKDTSKFNRTIVILLAVQLPYFIIALMLFVLLFKNDIEWRYNKNKFLTILSIILLFVGISTLIWNGILKGFGEGIYDTIIYGIGFGILFLLSINSHSIWMKVLLWTRLIEVWGPLIGYNAVPAAFGRYTGGAFGHFGYGLQGMITSPFFLTDFSVQIFSVIGVMYLLSKAEFKWFWIISFSIGAVAVGLILSYVLPILF